MSEHDPTTLASLAMRLRASTELPPLACMDVLRPLEQSMRERYVAHYETTRESILRDPIEFDPRFQDIIAAVAAEAERMLEAGELGDGRRGRSWRKWVWMKDELARGHQIVWRTPLEIMPFMSLG